MPNPGFFSATVDDQSEIAQLQAELQVEKDRHRVLVQQSHDIERKQLDRDAATALQSLEAFAASDSTPSA